MRASSKACRVSRLESRRTSLETLGIVWANTRNFYDRPGTVNEEGEEEKIKEKRADEGSGLA